jgi:tetratricopeptide (TPR) repeat protein
MPTRLHTVGFAALAALASACGGAEAPATGSTAPLYDNLGNHHHPITASPEAQRYFDQGLTLSYAFNHAEAIRSFEQAAALDPACAMCYWGVAFALGPNINAPITEDAAAAAWKAIGEARSRAASVSEREQAYIEALANRYTPDPKAERAPLDRAYADAMRALAAKYPDDLDAATLYAQSVMDTSPWNYWGKDGTPHPFTADVLSALEGVLARKPDHIGAIHLYIHAVEASDNPGRAEAYADRLAALVPGAGHLVHMPAHVYLRVGRYADAASTNEQAVKSDEAYFAGNPVAGNMTYQVGYVPHNHHFIVAAASFQGRRARAMEAARATRAGAHADMFRDPAMGGMAQHFALTPVFTMMRFALWDQILAEPAPPDDLPYMRAIWHTARGLALTGRRRLDEAQKEQAALAAIKDHAALTTLYVSSVNTASSIVAIGHEILAGEIAAASKRADEAAAHFAKAVSIEDGLTYMEPPDWPISVRQLQGAALLELGRAVEAEAAFRGDLRKFPNNGWSLSGLQTSLERQGKGPEAGEVKGQLDKAWSQADTKIAGGRAESPVGTPPGC